MGAFWFAYVVTRPLGASFADYVSKPHSLSGVNFGNGQTAVGLTLIVAVLVLYLAIARPDIQPPLGTSRDGERLEAAVADKTGATGSGLGSQRPTPNRYIGGWSARRGRLLAWVNGHAVGVRRERLQHGAIDLGIGARTGGPHRRRPRRGIALDDQETEVR